MYTIMCTKRTMYHPVNRRPTTKITSLLDRLTSSQTSLTRLARPTCSARLTNLAAPTCLTRLTLLLSKVKSFMWTFFRGRCECSPTTSSSGSTRAWRSTGTRSSPSSADTRRPLCRLPSSRPDYSKIPTIASNEAKLG